MGAALAEKSPRRIATVGTVAASLAMAGTVRAAEVEVKLPNKGTDGGTMAFEPAFVKIASGDTVKLLSTDKGHDPESIKGILPAPAPRCAVKRGMKAISLLAGFATLFAASALNLCSAETANTPSVIALTNNDTTAEEFDSTALKVEKVVAAKSSGNIRIRALAPGRYPFVGEYHADTAKGVVVAE